MSLSLQYISSHCGTARRGLVKLGLNLVGIYPNRYFSFLTIICPKNKQVASMYCVPIIADVNIIRNDEKYLIIVLVVCRASICCCVTRSVW